MRVKGESVTISELIDTKQVIVRDDVVFCFDVDGTLINGNSHNYIGNKLFLKYENIILEGRDDEIRGYMQEFLADPKEGWKNKKETEDLMSEVFKADYKIAVVTHNMFPVAIKYLIEQLALSAEDKSKIFVVLGNFVSSRQKQIERVKLYFEIEKFQNIVLIDDNEDNIDTAKKTGIATVIVNKSGTEYLKYASKLLHNFINPDEVSTEKLSSDDSSDEVMEISFEKGEGYNSDEKYDEWQSTVLGNSLL